ncbi:hypothetical protein V2J09_016856 [Rumex salicifolius]
MILMGDDFIVSCYYIDAELNAYAIFSAQEVLERANIPFVGTRSRECCKAFDKYEASMKLDRLGD